jgi:uncharacterized cofD-like protein
MIRRHRLRRLFAPAAGLRNSLVALFAGLFLFAVGAALSFKLVLQPALQAISRGAYRVLQTVVSSEDLDTATHYLGGAFLILGVYLMVTGARSGFRRFVEVINPGLKRGMADVYVRRQKLSYGPRIVALGGGTGLSTLLKGLKQHSSNITAIVTVTDDGGSSGRLIMDKGMIPPGDIRNCLVALADAEKAMTDLFQHRFTNQSGSLSGHSVGNLLIAALVDQARGDFERAVEIASDVLAIRGRVLPSTLDHVRLRAVLDDGREISGETAIVEAHGLIRQIKLDPEDCKPHPAAIEAIRDADLICIGPGSVYTSVIPNLLVPGISDAIRSSSAIKTYICNVMTQPGESDSFTASEHVSAVLNQVHARLFDHVLVNVGIPSAEAQDRYRDSDQYFVEPDIDRIRAMGLRALDGDYLSNSDLVRHDPLKLASRVVALLNQ